MSPLRIFMLSALMAAAGGLYSQNFTYYRIMTVNNAGAAALTDHQVLVQLDSSNFNYASVTGANGEDIRFAETVGMGGAALDYYIEEWNPAGTSLIWVKLPSIPASGMVDFEMHYGDAGTTTSASNFGNTFPNAFISSGSATLTGLQDYDWFEILAGDTISVGTAQVLEIRAQRVIIAGDIDGTGAGHQQPGGSQQPGTGPGGGLPSTTAEGSGGGGYGGDGGFGGADGSAVGPGGPAYGTSDGTTIEMGSSGASGGGSAAAGHGGGGVDIRGAMVTVSGAITCNGTNGAISGQSAGGGSGGGILIGGYEVIVSGAFTADGGDGGDPPSSANDGGGGGGGGRIKILYVDAVDDTSTAVANGGLGGATSTTAPGEDGDPGTVHVGQEPTVIDAAAVTIGAEVLFNEQAAAALAAGSALSGPTNGPFTIAVDPGETLANVSIELTDADADDITVVSISTLTSSPTGVTEPPIPAPGQPIVLTWTGTAEATNAPGDYAWEVEFVDAVNGTPVIVDVIVTIRDLPPVHAILDASSGDGSSANPYLADYFPGDTTSKAIDLAIVADPNEGQPVTLVTVVQVSGPTNGAGFDFSLSGDVLTIVPAATLQPEDAGLQSFTIVVDDGTHFVQLQAAAFVYSSSGSLFFVNSPTLPYATLDQPYGPETLQVMGGTAPYTFSEAGGTLPAGLTLNAATGEISGTPTALGASTLFVRVVDANNDTLTGGFTVLVLQPASAGGSTGSAPANDSSCASHSGAAWPLALLALVAGAALGRRRRAA